MGALKSPVIILCLAIASTLSKSVNNTPKNDADMDMKEHQMEFLKKYGYMGDLCPDEEMQKLSKTNPEEAFKRAVRMYQKFYNLEVTGEVNKETIELMRKPRCGKADVFSVEQVHDLQSNSSRSKRYATLYGGGWGGSSITYRVSKYIQRRINSYEITNSDVDPILARAFSIWAKEIPLTIHKTSNYPNIDIRFEYGAHGDGDPFDGRPDRYNILAHAASPYYGGDIHFDDDEIWTQNTGYGTNFFLVAVHEIGHALGLDHTSVSDAIMYASYSYRDEATYELHPDDINGIQYLYGKNTETTTTSTSTTPSTSTSPSTTTAPSTSSPTSTTPSTTTGSTTTLSTSTTSTATSTSSSSITTTTADSSRSSDGSNFCELSSIDAAYFTETRLAYFFKGDYVSVYGDNFLVEGYPKLIQDVFPQLPSDLDAVLELPDLYTRNCFWYRGRRYCSWYYTLKETARTYFFKGDTYYMYQDNSFYESGSIADEFPGIPTPIDAVTSDGAHLFFMTGSNIWDMQRLHRVITGPPTLISSFTGLPSTLDAAFAVTHGNYLFYYLFEGEQYFRITRGRSSVDNASPSYPRPFNTWWFGCPSSMVALQDGPSSGDNRDIPNLNITEPVTSVFVDQDGEVIGEFEVATEEEVQQGTVGNGSCTNLRNTSVTVVLLTLGVALLFV